INARLSLDRSAITPFEQTTRLDPSAALFPYTTLFRSKVQPVGRRRCAHGARARCSEQSRRKAVTQSHGATAVRRHASRAASGPRDRKSTRLNSSHVSISYAVFCLKKKSWPARVGQLHA